MLSISLLEHRVGRAEFKEESKLAIRLSQLIGGSTRPRYYMLSFDWLEKVYTR